MCKAVWSALQFKSKSFSNKCWLNGFETLKVKCCRRTKVETIIQTDDEMIKIRDDVVVAI